MEHLLEKQQIAEKVKNLVGIEKRYYEFLPDTCWMSEETQAKRLKIGRTKLRRIKNKLIQDGLLQLQIQPNGKRKNLKHVIQKSYPIILKREESLLSRYCLEDDKFDYQPEIDWSLLQQHTAEDINAMDKIAKVELYMDCGFIVLPTHYSIFTPDGVECSCKLGINCSSKGKHPIHK